MICRGCGAQAETVFLDLQSSPPSNSFLSSDQLDEMEPYFPLKVFVCDKCLLTQIDEYKQANEIFSSDYVYFSSYSEAFVQHARQYVEQISSALDLNSDSFVVEAASNDGYLLQFFQSKNIPCVGVEPSGSTAEIARSKGIETIGEFFTAAQASNIVTNKGQADLFIGNNVIAHVPNLNDFIAGIATILKPTGTATLEFPHLLNLIEDLQFDTVYHEHFSYFSLLSIQQALARHGLEVYKVDEVDVHGGSLRIHCAKKTAHMPIDESVENVLDREKEMQLHRIETYTGMQEKVDALCADFIEFLVQKKREGAVIAGYGAAAKGNTMLNYCGIKPSLMDFVSDITPAKQGKYLPGSHIPVFGEDELKARKPDYIVILPWNWKTSITERLEFTREWGAQFVTAIPKLEVF